VLDRMELALTCRQIIVLHLVDYNVHIDSQQMNLLLTDIFPHVYLGHRPNAQATLKALERRHLVAVSIQGWRATRQGKKMLKDLLAMFEEEEKEIETTAQAI